MNASNLDNIGQERGIRRDGRVAILQDETNIFGHFEGMRNRMASEIMLGNSVEVECRVLKASLGLFCKGNVESS